MTRFRARQRLVACWLAVAATAGCATGGFVRPAGPPTPFPEADILWRDLTRVCRDVTSYRAQLRVSGRLNGQRIPGLSAGLALERDRLAMNLRWGATPEISMAGPSTGLTLLMHRSGQVVRGPADDVVEALIGARLSPATLLSALTGCVAADTAVTRSEKVGAFARLTVPDGVVYLRQRSGAWELAASELGDLVIDYRRLVDGWPREIVIRQAPGVALGLQVVEFERNPELTSGLFQLSVPASFADMSVEQLRADGPLGARRE